MDGVTALGSRRDCDRRQIQEVHVRRRSIAHGDGQRLEKHSAFVADVAEDCRKREANARRILDSVHLIHESFANKGWQGVYEKLQRVVQLTSIGSEMIPPYVTTMYSILERAINHPTEARSEAEFEQLQEFRSKIYDMVEDAIGRRHEAYGAQVEWESENLPLWRARFQAVEVQDKCVALLKAVCKTCDQILEQKDKLLKEDSSAETGSTALPGTADSTDSIDEESDCGLTIQQVGPRGDAYRAKFMLPDMHGTEGHQCKPCYFPPGQCRQGNDCPYLHMCDKPKRKSKTQRLVEKRRQERYRMIESTGNTDALQAVKTVDEARRKFLNGSDLLKQDLKKKLLSGNDKDTAEAQQKLEKLNALMGELDALV
mmetsp:Transcript_19623/g.45616  ORF Transcript_19623/g.45616 Transcript_19623/m.45616 type:complete len:371 (+) Transcript_19623:36-1148(+)